MTKTLTQIDSPHSGADCHQCEELLPLANRLRELGLDAGIDPSTGGGVHVVYLELVPGEHVSYPDVYVYANIEGAGLYDQRQGDDHTLACEGVEQISFDTITDQTDYAAAAIEVEAMVERWRASGDDVPPVLTVERQTQGSRTFCVLLADGVEIDRAGGKRAERAAAVLVVGWPSTMQGGKGGKLHIYGLRSDLAKAEVEAARLLKPRKMHGAQCTIAAFAACLEVEA